jgi:hypothetical protein
MESYDKRNVITGGDHLEQRFKDAGFVDIKVTKSRKYIGNWVGGFP